MSVLTHYDVLSVDPTAELETIRRAWRLKVRLLHPDRHHDSPLDVQAEAERETLRINKAWDTLRDPDKRHHYDVHLLELRDVDLEREKENPQDRHREDEADREHAQWSSPYYYLNVASFLIVLVASAFVVAGAVLLAGMTQ